MIQSAAWDRLLIKLIQLQGKYLLYSMAKKTRLVDLDFHAWEIISNSRKFNLDSQL